MSKEKRLTGRVPRDAIRRMTLPPIASEILERFTRLPDATSSVSDAMDDLGLFAAVPASILQPNLPGRLIIGRAVTVRNVARADTASRAAAEVAGGMGEHEAYNLAEAGDIVVIQGLPGISNMGGQSAALAQRSGGLGAVIDGGYRDPQSSRDANFPIWSRGVTPVTGKWRLRTVEINGRIDVCGAAVAAGDLVVADEGGVVFVPHNHLEAVLREAERIAAGDTRPQ
jgi:4-hydroxy-4-methyl-2-oxoglutarate aldolase